MTDRDNPLQSATAAERQRAFARYRQVGLGVVASGVSAVAALLLMVLTVHWAVPAYGAERFGIWATFSSLAATLALLDLGVGNALINRVAQASALGSPADLRRVIMGGIGWLAAIGLAIAALLVTVSAFLPWGELLKLSGPAAAAEARAAAITFSLLFGLSLVSGGIMKILAGQQRLYESQLISAVSVCVACPAIWYAVKAHLGVAALLLAGFGIQAVIGILAGLAILASRGQIDVAALAASMRLERGHLLRTGGLFFALQIGCMIGWGADTLIVATLSGAAQVAVFAVAQRLYQLAAQAVQLLNAPLWAAYADARSHGDRKFLRDTLRRMFLASLVAGASLSLAFYFLSPVIIPLWTDRSLVIPQLLLAMFTVWTTIEAAGCAVGTYLNGVGIVREQLIVTLAFCLVALPLKVVATLHAGASGLIAATAIAYVLTIALPYATVLRRRILAPPGPGSAGADLTA